MFVKEHCAPVFILKGPLMPNYIEKAEVMTLPVVVLKGIVAFPVITINVEITDAETIQTVKRASESGSHILFVTSREIKDPPYSENELYSIGTVAKIKQSLMTQEGSLRIIAEGLSRASISNFYFAEDGFISASALCKTLLLTDAGIKGDAYIREALDALEADYGYLTAGGLFPEELIKNFIKAKRAECSEISKVPHPVEFEKYYNL